MPWSAVISSDDVVAIHAALLPTVNGDGEVILFGGDDHDQAANIAGHWDHSRRFNCRHPTQALMYVQSPNVDLFCCGHAQLGDGRLLTGGGTITFPPESEGIHSHLHFEGHRHAFTYNGTTSTFSEVASMGFEPGTMKGGGRWYPSLCTLATGEVLAVAGHPAGDDARHNNNRPERYQPVANRWIMVAPTGPDSVPGPDLFPRLHLLRDGSVFVSSALQGNARCIALDPWTGASHDVCDLPDASYRGFDCPSVLLPLTPNDGYQERLLLCGGVTSQLLDLGQANPGWTDVPRTGSAAGKGRTHAGATILPTGDVLLNGGADPANDQSGVMEPELYATPIDHAAGTPSYVGGPGSWTTINEPATVLRNYHSSALLMPDGRVWTAGGNSPNQPGMPPTATQKQIEIFTPAYPAGPRPTITSCPTVLAYGDRFDVQTPQAQQIRAVTLLRCGSSTHAFNPDQRCIFLEFDALTANRLQVTAPPGGGVAPPGNYMVFLIDTKGRPCAYARFIRVGGQMSVFTDRSTFSQHEVQALLSGTDSSIPDAVYLVVDGFTAQDITGTSDRPSPPVLSFTFEDTNTDVPGITASLDDTLYENPTAPSGVAQRITLGYRLTFADTNAFDGIAPDGQRAIRITATWGPSKAFGQIIVFRHEHVYSQDGPTPWLSIDVQVLQLPRHAHFAEQPNDDPAVFIGKAITAMRGTPDNSAHPFAQLAQSSATARLELADSVGGVAQDNFAFARVRFRAPIGVSAADVKVFFRMFTTAATTLTYNGTVYKHIGSGAAAIAQPGIVNGEVVSQPFFAAPRDANPATQQDSANVFTLAGAGSTEVVSFFGAWLDFNHVATIRNRIRGQHQCIVAEIYFPPSPIPIGAAPADNDQLSQRNLAIVESDNPGNAAAHTVAHTFDLTPSRAPLPATMLTHEMAMPTVNRASLRRSDRPDELFLRWHNLPRESTVQLYLPDVDIEQVLLTAGTRPGYDSITVIDDHTLGCRVGDATYLPLPGGRSSNIAGLITIQLPLTVRTGETYRITAHQVSGQTSSIIASFQIVIPVSTATRMVPEAQRTFEVLTGVGATIATDDRWRPVFDRYLQVLGTRLTSIGGEPHPDGHQPDGQNTEECTGKVVSILYDCFGDFEGFVLDCCGSRHTFHAREDRIWALIQEAASRRLAVTIAKEPDDKNVVHRIALHFH